MKFLKIASLLALAMVLIFSCSKEQLNTKEGQAAEKRAGNDVDICHNSAGTWHKISVNVNSLPAHLAHGDVVLVDADGDGWVEAENECVPGGDCNDEDPTINPGAVEVCGDGIDNNCDSQTDEGCVACPDCSFSEILNNIDLTDACAYEIGDGVWVLLTYGAIGNGCCGIVVFPQGYWVTDSGLSGESSSECYACFVEYLIENEVPACSEGIISPNPIGIPSSFFSDRK